MAGFRTGCWNVSRQQQSFSGLQSPWSSFSVKVCYSWVQTISYKFWSCALFSMIFTFSLILTHWCGEQKEQKNRYSWPMIAAGFSSIFLCSLAPSLFNETTISDFNETNLSDIGNHLSWDVLHSSTFKVTKCNINFSFTAHSFWVSFTKMAPLLLNTESLLDAPCFHCSSSYKCSLQIFRWVARELLSHFPPKVFTHL